MSLLLFAGALVGIVLLGALVNRLTGTKALYLDGLQLEKGEQELWRDQHADFGTLSRSGRAAVTSFPRLRRHTVVWTDRRIVVAQKVLFSSRRMVTHQIPFAPRLGSVPGASGAAAELAGGFYGRGFYTIVAAAAAFGRVDGKDCVRVTPTPDSGEALNVQEALIFTDRLSELRKIGSW